MLTGKRGCFDVKATTDDQVYGGATAETPAADSAVRATEGLVLTWRDSLADIYYHSTCGGRTAAVDEAWDRPACPYLQSESDLAPDGTAYCANSPLFEWEESWDAPSLSAIVRRAVATAAPDARFEGPLRAITVVDRFGSAG